MTAGRHETDKERLDRNLTELLGELRVALPGIQVLFAFLLVVPFNQGYSRMTAFDRDTYFATLLCTTLASILLIAPTVHHRLEFRRDDKAHLVHAANRLSIAGHGALALAMTGAMLLVSNFVFGTIAAIIVTSAVLATFVLVWYELPLRRRATLPKPPAGSGSPAASGSAAASGAAAGSSPDLHRKTHAESDRSNV
ncbi:MAG: hypothetical protein QOH12_3460 [Solirubrobacteraceae bacterium]|jgi:hypothetical protein|nr:hypothetical protein [Solirubrobacteraceae bacterium]